MNDKPTVCSCGARLWSRDELLALGDPLLQHVALDYIDEDSGFCIEEDEVVPYEWLRTGIPTPLTDAEYDRIDGHA